MGLALSLSPATILGAQSAAQNLPINPTSATTPTEPGSNLTVYLLTIGWGDVVWERFGHNAIWIRDRTSGTDITYNWECSTSTSRTFSADS